MLSKLSVIVSSVFLRAVFCLLVSTTPALADVVVERDETIFGKITKITNEIVIIERGCRANNTKEVSKSRVRYFEFNSNCDPYSVAVNVVASTCNHDTQARFNLEQRRLYQVSFVGMDAEVYASDIFLDQDRTIQLELSRHWGMLKGPVDKVSSIKIVCLQKEDIRTDQFAAPSLFSFEPPSIGMKGALKPSYGTILFNESLHFDHCYL